MKKSDAKVLLIGLPQTGKTTFLAALWHVVDSDEVPNSMRLTKQHGDREYLNRIREMWLSCQELPRTQIGAEENVSMYLSEPGQEDVIELAVPDLSGESFESQWLTRQWTSDYLAVLTDAVGALLFIHPSEIVEPIRIDEANHVMEGLGVEQGNEEKKSTETPWDPAEAPTQVKLIELLQFIALGIEGRPLEFRLSVLVSAWDLISDTTSPEEWVKSILPMLHQFLGANSQVFPHRYFGISAQGGVLANDKEQLALLERPSERILVVGDGSQGHDISDPIRWLTDQIGL